MSFGTITINFTLSGDVTIWRGVPLPLSFCVADLTVIHVQQLNIYVQPRV